ncbi:MAG: hypothetical protein RL319_611 [Actinomycetota bacterium]
MALSNGRDLYESIASQLIHGWNVIHALAPGYKSIGEDQTSKSIGNDLDRNFLIEMRRHSDAIVTTGKTAIAENYRSSKFATVSVLSDSFDFKNSNLAIRSPELNLLFTHGGSVADLVNQDETVVRKVLLNAAQEPFEQIKDCLSEAEPRKLLFEGGLTSLRQLLMSKTQVRVFFTLLNETGVNAERVTRDLSDLLGTQLELRSIHTDDRNTYLVLESDSSSGVATDGGQHVA